MPGLHERIEEIIILKFDADLIDKSNPFFISGHFSKGNRPTARGSQRSRAFY